MKRKTAVCFYLIFTSLLILIVNDSYADENDIQFLKVLANAGLPKSQNSLGYYYITGQGLEKNPVKARYWFLKAASQGNIGALFNLGLIYKDGIGVSVDLKKSFYYFKSAAEKGDSESQVIVGQMYQNGNGVPINYREAVQWYKKANAQGNAEAQKYLDRIYQSLEARTISKKSRIFVENGKLYSCPDPLMLIMTHQKPVSDRCPTGEE